MKVLVLDDNPLTAMVLAGTLRSHNFDVAVVYRAMEGLQYLAENPEIQLILVDLMMPEMDGFEFVSKLKEEPYWRDVPVVMCTALASMEAVSRSASLGCRFYVLKPVTEEQLMLKVWQALESTIPILEHRDSTIERVGMDSDTYEHTLGTFAIILDGQIKKLEGAVSPDVETMAIDFSEVIEGAQLLGAKRLSRLLDKFLKVSKPDVTDLARTDWALISQEMVSLRRALAPSNITTFSV